MECCVNLENFISNFTFKLVLFVWLEKAKGITHFI